MTRITPGLVAFRPEVEAARRRELAEKLSEWDCECLHYWGRVLTGKKRHWCHDWDMLPIDETTREIEACTCLDVPEGRR